MAREMNCHSRVACISTIAMIVFAAAWTTREAVAAPTTDGAAEDKPVLLLTGFEPFGPGRPANPSWEGIRGLEGRELAGYRIVCREMKVEWGTPLTQLTAWIEEFHPATVFSFGQGGPAGFAIETRARNQRGDMPDNLGQLPAQPTIASDGSKEYELAIDGRAMVESLVRKGHTVRISTDAGQYLCEEALYSLEYLKSKRRFQGDVLFCHVPPLGAAINDVRVDADYVQHFVEDLIAIWAELPDQDASVAAPATTTLRQAVADPREKVVRELIDRYFLTWSAQDIDRYGQCFMPQAAVQLLDPAGRLTTLPLRAFLQSQRDAHAATPGMKETPESVEVRFEGKLARVVVNWKLVAGEKVQYGYDHFTLAPSDGQWRIANLIFYEMQSDD